MKILMVAPLSLTYPPKDGYSMVVIYLAYFLKNFYNVESDIMVPEDEKYSAKDLIDSGIFNKVYNYQINSKWRALFKSFFSKDVYTMVRNDINDKDLKKFIVSINNAKYDAIIFNHSFSFHLYRKLIKHINDYNYKIIYWSHNIDYLYFKNMSKEARNPVEKFFYYFSYKKLKNIEVDFIKSVDNIVSVSKHEVEYLRKINPRANVFWIPPLIPELKLNKEEKLCDFDDKLKNYQYKILFTGSLGIPQNVKPTIWFAKEVFPIIKNKLNACFIIAGKNPSKEIINLSKRNNDIILYPNVPSMTQLYKISDLVVVPLFSSSGIKLKLIEALKYEKKVVARPEALLGAGLEKLVPNAREPQEFAKKCIDALEGKIDYTNIFREFRNIYDNKMIIDDIIKILSW